MVELALPRDPMADQQWSCFPAAECRRLARRPEMWSGRTWVVLATAGVLGIAMANPGGAQERPQVDLAERVPATWLNGADDRLPLRSERWRKRLPRRCWTRGGYRRLCQGKRRVPEPQGDAAERAVRLALGQRATALQLVHDGPFEEWVQAAADRDPVRRMDWPVPAGRLTRGFGWVRRQRLRHRPHKGIDIAADEGSPVHAVRGGLVAYGDNGLTGYGNTLIVVHSDGTTALYAHCRALHVFAGQHVERGQHVADVGHTGFAGAPHLHFEWRSGGWPRNPLPHMHRPPPAPEAEDGAEEGAGE
jgi:murein DD-endopeptidase MepM/ murein hydrolase activator NlpD